MNLVVMIVDRMSEAERTVQTLEAENVIQTTTDGGQNHGNGVSITGGLIWCLTKNALPPETLGKER
jgi:hypothetical protein